MEKLREASLRNGRNRKEASGGDGRPDQLGLAEISNAGSARSIVSSGLRGRSRPGHAGGRPPTGTVMLCSRLGRMASVGEDPIRPVGVGVRWHFPKRVRSRHPRPVSSATGAAEGEGAGGRPEASAGASLGRWQSCFGWPGICRWRCTPMRRGSGSRGVGVRVVGFERPAIDRRRSPEVVEVLGPGFSGVWVTDCFRA